MKAQEQKFDEIENWLNQVAMEHSHSEGTRLMYRHHVSDFCQYIDQTPEEIIKEYENPDERAVKRKYTTRVKAYMSMLYAKNYYAPNTLSDRITAIKSFFRYNNLPLDHVPKVRQQVKFHNRDITKEEIKAILEVSSPREKAFFAIMAQSGIRPDTLCHLRLKHLEPDFSKGVIPCKVEVPQDLAKGDYHAYFTFIGEEAVNYLKAYLNTRRNVSPEDYMFTKFGTNENANPKAISGIFMHHCKALKAKGILNYEVRADSKPSELRLYTLRKYFKKHSTQMGSEESEFLMGHGQGVKDHYLAKDPEHYRQLYTEHAMPFLRIETPNPTETEQQIKDQAKTIKDLQLQVEKLLWEKGSASQQVQKELDNFMAQIRRAQAEFETRIIQFAEKNPDAKVSDLAKALKQKEKI